MPTAAPAMPVKPSRPAMMAITKNVMAQLNIRLSSFQIHRVRIVFLSTAHHGVIVNTVLVDAGFFSTRCNRMLTKTVATDSTHSLIMVLSRCCRLHAIEYECSRKDREIGLQCGSCAAML